MKVQTTPNLATAYTPPKSVLLERDSSTTPANIDKVTISAAAAELAAKPADQAKETQYSISDSKYAWLSKAAHEDSAFAESFTKTMINEPPIILYDADSAFNPPLRFAITKQIATPERVAAFMVESKDIVAKRLDIFQSEKAKGSSYAEILDKLITYNDSLPESYRQFTGWGMS